MLTAELTGQTITIWRLQTNQKDEIVASDAFWTPHAGKLRYGDRILVDSTGGGKPHAFTLAVTYRAGRKIRVQPDRLPPS
jgi:hypothetical protein